MPAFTPQALQASEAGRAGALEPAGDLGHHWGGKIGGIWVLDLRRPSGDPPVTSVERRPFEFERPVIRSDEKTPWRSLAPQSQTRLKSDLPGPPAVNKSASFVGADH